MGPLSSIFLILLGMLTVLPILKAKKSPGVDMVESMIPYQKGLGALAAVVGAVCILFDLIHVQELFYAPVFWFARLLGDLLLLGLGLLLGYEVLQANLLKDNEKLESKAADILERLQERKTQLGYSGIAFGVVALVLALFH